MIVKEELEKLGVEKFHVSVGSIYVSERLKSASEKALRKNLYQVGLILLNHSQSADIENLKETVHAMLSSTKPKGGKNEVAYIKARVQSDFDATADLFAEVTGISVQQFILIQKLEQVKIWLLYSDSPIKELAQKFNFKNTENLRRHFKKLTGIAPVYYRKLKEKRQQYLANFNKSDSFPQINNGA